MNNIAIIPARSGSKRVKDKNIRELGGKPLMAYAIEAALASAQFQEVMVSTDSERYAEIAKQYGAHVPFLRSTATATDAAVSWDMAAEVLATYEQRGQTFDTFCLLQPTSPLRSAEDIVRAYGLYREKASFAVVSVCEAEHSPLWCGRLPDSHELAGFIAPDNLRQEEAKGKFYRLNGAIYIVNVQRFRQDRFLYKAGSFAYVMEQDRSVDIDTEWDFRLAEFCLRAYQSVEKRSFSG